MPLSSAVAISSNKIVQAAFEDVIQAHLPNQRWIGPRNHYAIDTVGKINSIANVSQIKKKALSEYIASSTILHCYDGWNYISRASESLIQGDVSSAIHLIYYSELRSVMSLMAAEGIGIFDRKHVWFDVNELPYFNANRITTHQAADTCITEWSKLSSKKEIIFSLIKVNNRSLRDWINGTQFTANSKYSSLIAKEWLEKWSIDLRLTDDQKLRNEMSYRPHFKIQEVDIKLTVEKLSEIWKGLEPTGTSTFSELDNHLFRIALEKVYSKWKGRRASGVDYEKFVGKMFDNIGESKSQNLFNFLLRAHDTNDHFILLEAKKDLRDNRINLSDPFPMLCRAILMLRLATGAVNQMISESAAEKELFRHWWEGICKGNGILTHTDGGGDTSELFADISDSIREIEESPDALWSSLKSAIPDQSKNLNILKQFQRACFWGMGL